ncbi:hypothetical protein Tco_1361917 [Tanacetum coccineum]
MKSRPRTLALDVLKLTPFYNAFEISADVPEIYMQEFWVTVSRHHSSLRSKLNGKSHTVNVDNFRDMLKICPKLPGQIFEEPPLEEEILSFIRDLGHTDLVYQVENKNSKKKNDMYYLRFTKVIVDYFMAKDQAIPRRNKMFWHYARDDFVFTTIRIISKHQDTQVYGAILPQHLTNQAMLESKAYMTYHAYATGEKTPKPKSTKKKADSESSPKMKLTQASKGKRIKTVAKGDKPAKKKQSVTKSKGLTVLSEVALIEAEQIKLATKRSLIQTYSSHASSSGADEETGSIPRVPDVPTYESDDEKISWKSSEEEDDDEVNVSKDNDDDADNDDDVDKDYEDDDADNQDDEIPDNENQDNDDDFVHPNLSTHDDEEIQDDKVNEEESDEESDDESNEDNDEEVQGANIEEEEMDEEATHEEDEANELYRDVNVNLEGRDTAMTDALRTTVQTTQVIEDTHVIITPVNPESQQQSSSVSFGFISNMLNPSLDTGIDTIFTPNTEATSLVDVSVTTIAEPPFLSATTLQPTPLITHLQQTPVPTPVTVLRPSLQDLPNFGSLFGFDHRLKTLETDFSEFKQTNQFAEAVSSILGIIDAYLANKMHEAVKTVVQLQSKRLKDEAQAENAEFLNKLDDNIKKIIKDQVKEQVKDQVSKILPKIKKTVNEQLEAEVMTRSSTESKTSLAIAANLCELELKKILVDKIESNKSIHRSDEQNNLYKALVDTYESEKLILDTYGDMVLFKRRRDDEDKDEEPSAGSNRGSKRRQAGKEPESTSAPKEKTSKTSGMSYEGSKSKHKIAGESAQTEEPMHTTKDLKEPAHQEFEIGRPTKLPSPDCDWNKTLPDAHGLAQPWLNSLAQKKDPRDSFNELMDTPLDFSAFVMNRLKVDTLTPELLTGPTFELMKGSCKSLPLPLIPNSRGRHVIPFDHFINNDLEYLSGGVSSRKYATLVTKTKAADYGHIKWIKDLVPNRMESARDVYSKRRIIAVTKLEIVDRHNYKHLNWITVHRDDDKLYKFKEGDFNMLCIQDIEDMLLLLVQGKLTNLTIEERLAFNNKDKKNILMRIDELYKFSDGILNDVRTALNDRLKGIRMEYLPQTIWRQSDKDKAGAMIQAIDKQLNTRFYTLARNPVKEILFKLNLPDHRLILTDSKEQIKMEIEFWNPVYKHDTFYRFKIDKKKQFKLTLEVFRDIFQICPRVLGRDFDPLPSEEYIVSFLRELGHTREINSLNDVVFDEMHQPCRTFVALINRGLSGKTSGLDKLCLSRAQILWGNVLSKKCRLCGITLGRLHIPD